MRCDQFERIVLFRSRAILALFDIWSTSAFLPRRIPPEVFLDVGREGLSDINLLVNCVSKQVNEQVCLILETTCQCKFLGKDRLYGQSSFR